LGDAGGAGAFVESNRSGATFAQVLGAAQGPGGAEQRLLAGVNAGGGGGGGGSGGGGGHWGGGGGPG
jgi:hypothetical protein